MKEQHSEHYMETKKQLKNVVECIHEGRDEMILNTMDMSIHYQNDHSDESDPRRNNDYPEASGSRQ